MAPFCEKGDGVTMAENPSLSSLGPRPCPALSSPTLPNPVTPPAFFFRSIRLRNNHYPLPTLLLAPAGHSSSFPTSATSMFEELCLFCQSVSPPRSSRSSGSLPILP